MAEGRPVPERLGGAASTEHTGPEPKATYLNSSESTCMGSYRGPMFAPSNLHDKAHPASGHHELVNLAPNTTQAMYFAAGLLLGTEQGIGGPLKTLREGLLQDDLLLFRVQGSARFF